MSDRFELKFGATLTAGERVPRGDGATEAALHSGGGGGIAIVGIVGIVIHIEARIPCEMSPK